MRLPVPKLRHTTGGSNEHRKRTPDSGIGVKLNNASRRRLLRLANVLVAAAVAVGLVIAFRRDGPEALSAWRAADVRLGWLAAAVGAGLVGHALNVFGWQRVLRDCSVSISFLQTARFFAVGNLGRYLPGGKAWQLGIIGVMAAELNLATATVVGTSLLIGVIGVVVGAALLLALGGVGLGLSPALLIVPLSGLALLQAAPALLRWSPRFLDRISARWPQATSITLGTMWTMIWTAAASWVSWGLALHALARTVLTESGASLSVYIAAWIGPFIAGLIAFVAPAGLGVREELMRVTLVGGGLEPAWAVLLVVLARFGATILDVGPALLLQGPRLLGRARRKTPAGETDKVAM